MASATAGRACPAAAKLHLGPRWLLRRAPVKEDKARRGTGNGKQEAPVGYPFGDLRIPTLSLSI